MVPLLELHLTVAEAHAAEAARFLRGRLEGPQWQILAALAAEVVSIHEAASQGAAVVVVASAAEAKALVGFPAAPSVR